MSQRKQKSRSWMPKVMSLLFLAPWIIGFLAFALTPIITMIAYSRSNVIFRPSGTILKHVGLDNFRRVLFSDPDFRMQLPSYLNLIIFLLPIIMVFSILLASLLHETHGGKGFFRAIYFLPVMLISPPFLKDLFAIDAFSLDGLEDFFIFKFIIEEFPGAFSTHFIFIMNNLILCLWLSGVQLLIFLSALQKIDPSLYEAAEVEGASRWQIFWKINIPILKPFILLNAVYTLVDLSTLPINPISRIITESMYQVSRGFGYSAAVAWLYMGVELLLLGLVYLILGRDHDARRRRALERDEQRRIRKLRKQQAAHKAQYA